MPLENVMMDVMLIVSPAHAHTNTIPGMQETKIVKLHPGGCPLPLCLCA